MMENFKTNTNFTIRGIQANEAINVIGVSVTSTK